MALKVHRVVVVGCPRCVLTGDMERLGVGKSCFCNRFVRPDSFILHHPSRLSEDLWRDSPAYNGDHFLYWGAATKRHSDGTKTRFQVVEQTEFFDIQGGEICAHKSQGGEGEYVRRAAAAHFISRGKVAYKVYEEEEYAIPSSLKSNPKRSRAVQLFPNNEFSEGKGVSGFICIFDPTLEGQNIKIQFEFLTKLINEILKTKRKVVVACTKCDEVNEARIQFGANLVASIRSKKPIPFIQVSAKEGINIDEAFNYIVGQYNVKKKVSYRGAGVSGGGKSSPVLLGLPYSELVRSRGKDESYAKSTLTRIIREKVTFFTAEWATTWPYLQLDPKCHEAANVIGLTETKKIFCQRIMELKVAEVKGKSKAKPREKKQEEKTRNCQSEILEAFSTHPDLINESAYDFVYTSSVPSFDTISSSSPLSPASPLHSSSVHSFQQPTNGSLPQTGSPVQQLTNMSPPPIAATPPSDQIPQVCPEPEFIAHYRSNTFSPLKTCLAVNSFASQQFNKSQELLSTLPRVNFGLQRHSSLRYKNRTLPPLPTSMRPRSETVMAKSQPHIDDTDDTDDDSDLDRSPIPGRIKRRLSNSMECLKSSGSIPDSIEASPYISPVNVQAVLAADKKKSSPLAISSVKVPPQSRAYPSLPDGFATLRRNGTHYQAKSNPRLFDGPVSMVTKPRSSSSPPPPPPASILDGPNPTCLLSPQDESSLDIGGDICRLRGPGGGVSILEGSGNESTEDDVSIISGPFAEVEEPDCLPPLMSEIKKSHESLSRMPSNFVIPQTATPTTTASESSLVDKLSESDGDKVERIYASIPGVVDEEYLTMKSGVSLEDLLRNTPSKGVNTAPLPTPKSVIKKLQKFTHKTEADMLYVRRSESPSLTSPNKVKKISGTSVQSVPVSRRSLDGIEMNPSLNRSGHRSTMFNRRPLPQSPVKLRKVSSIGGHGQMKRKNSVSDSKNIYETIDGEHTTDWLKQMKSAKPNLEDKVVGNSIMNLEKVLDHFLSDPVVQERWRSSVQSVYPEFIFPDMKKVTPFMINPAYFEYRSRSSSIEKIAEEPNSVDDEKEEDQLEPLQTVEPITEMVEESTPPQYSQPAHRAKIAKKESFTDVVLARLNQRLLMHQDSTSSSSEEESEDDEEEAYSETSSDCEGEYEVNGSQRELSLTSIKEQFDTHSEKLIALDSGGLPLPPTHQDSLNEEVILNGITHFGVDPSASSMWPPSADSAPLWTTPTQHTGHQTKVYINDGEESGTGSSSPTGPDPPTEGDVPLISSVIHPTPIKSSNNNHLTVCHFNSMDSGISANGNATSVDM